MIIELPKFEVKKLSENFWSFEFICRCRNDDCKITLIDTDLIDYLEKKRIQIGGLPIIISSGYRCAAWNKKEGGKSGSFHLIGKAADIYVPEKNMLKLAPHFADADGLGISAKDNFLHVDVRGYKARWKY